jgi:hypothetical protein
MLKHVEYKNIKLLKPHYSIFVCIPINNYSNNVKHVHYDLCDIWAGLYYLKHFIRSNNWEHSCNHMLFGIKTEF